MIKTMKILPVILIIVIVTACGIGFEGGNLKIKDNGKDIISIGQDGFILDGNMTGITLDGSGLRIEYPNGNLVWDSKGMDIKHASGTIRIADGSMVITDKDGKQEVLDTTGDGAEYKTEGGVLVRTGKKAQLPEDYPHDAVPLMKGFELDASALLGTVKVVTGHVGEKTVDDAAEYYTPLLDGGSSFSRETKAGSVVLRAKLDGLDVTIYLCDSLTVDAVIISVVIGAKQ